MCPVLDSPTMSPTTPAVNRTVRPPAGELPILVLLTFCFAASGLAALVYQTAWTRQFALVFGTSELAVATVLAAYMGGLALGAWLIERWLPRVSRPVLAYAGLELGIAVSALVLVPALLAGSGMLLDAAVGGQPEPPSSEQLGTSLFYLASALAALIVPTTLMGATLPLLARHAVHSEAQIGRRIGLLYAANTAGAVAGALIAAFWLLPQLGLRSTIWVAAAINILVFVVAIPVARARVPGDEPALAHESRNRSTTYAVLARDRHAWVLPLMLVSGAVSFLHEVLWTRMLAHVVGSSIYAFGVMVASFLAGIALGGAIAAWFARDRQRSIWALAVCQGGVALAAAGAWFVLQQALPQRTGLFQNILLGAALLMPMTLFIGATYPLAVRVLAADAEDAARASARVYAWNTVGAIVGALAGGFLIIPQLHYEGTIQLAVGISACLAVATLAMLLPWRETLQHPRHRLGLAGAAIAAIAVVAAFRPVTPDRLLLTSPLDIASEGTRLFYDVGRSASVIVLEQDGMLAMRTNGLPEALMDMSGSIPRFSGEFWLSPLAVVARPATRSMLIVGYGGGVVVEGVPPSVREIDVIELEPVVMAANEAVRPLRRRDPLSDMRVNVITNDARGAMRLTDRRYDAIVSQPSHPWTAGASHLYTREFMALARERLEPGGVFVQWMNVAFLDERLLRSLTATLIDVFGEARIYRPDPNTLVFLASSEPLDVEASLARSGVPLDLSPGHYSRFGINDAEDLVAALVADESGARALAAGAELITDDTNRMATSSVYELGRGMTADAAGRLLAPYDPLQRADSFVYRDLRSRLSMSYLADRVGTHLGIDASIIDRLRRMSEILGRTPEGAYVRGMWLYARGRGEDARQFLREKLASHPDDPTLRYALVRPWLGQLARGRAPEEIVAMAQALPAGAQDVLRAGRAAANGEWERFPALDPALAAVRWTDPWSLDALQLRADWRTRVSTPGARQALADEAIALVDRALVTQPSPGLLGLRARAAVAAERADMVVESVWSFAQATYATAAQQPPEQREAARRTLDGLVSLLDETARRGGNTPQRLPEVRDKLVLLAERLG